MIQRAFLLLFSILLTVSVYGQNQSFWQDQSAPSDIPESDRQIIPNQYRTLSLDFKGLEINLLSAPKWAIGASNSDAIVVYIPTPEAGYQRFKVVSASVMAPELAAKFPAIKSYKGWGIDDPTASIRFDISPQGFHGMVLSGSKTWFIDPYSTANKYDYIAYNKSDFQTDQTISCQIEENTQLQPEMATPEYGDCQLRTYRLAIACTGEYAQFHGGTVASVMSAMNTTITRVNGVYERELAVTLEIVANDDQLISLDANTDPYSNFDGEAMLNQNQTNVDNIIGAANYDIGHVFSTGGGGIASLRSPCTSFKARGVTGSPQPVNDPFDVDYVCHEMGHQFGGNHTQNNDCNRHDETAMETGSGSTIMGYAGVCFPNVQAHSNDYFHTASLKEIHANITVGQSSGCPTVVAPNNATPVANAGANYIIPVSTPFVLTGSATDGDGDNLTYCWEQMDSEVGVMPPEATATLGPVFRSYSPTDNPKRFFPAMANLFPDWEVLPSVSRMMKFRLTVRDNHPGGGCTTHDDMTVTTDAVAGPFVVTQPNTYVDWSAQSVRTVTWNVANTHLAPINTTKVDIFLSVNGGETYPIVLATNVPNDGSQSVTMPTQTTDNAKIMVKGHDNIFFDISDVVFTISAAQSGFSLSLTQDSIDICTPSSALTTINIGTIAGFTGDVSLSGINVPNGMTLAFSPQTVTVPNASNITISTTNTLAEGGYNMAIQATGTPGTVQKELYVFATNDAPSPATLLNPTNQQTGASVTPTLSWSPVNNSQGYTVELYDDSNLANLIESAIIQEGTSYQIQTTLSPATTYYWRILTANPCQEGVASSTFSFTTEAIFCKSFAANDLPLTMPNNATITLTSTISIIDAGTLTSIKVKNLDITHTWIKDLKIKLVSPNGTEIQLLSEICNGDDNILINFDDAAANSYAAIPCPPVENLTYQPMEALNTLIGEEINGDWKLVVDDLYAADGGTLNAWTLDLCYLVSGLTMNISTTNVSCFGNTNGSATVTVAAGTPPYTYTWSQGDGTNLSAGSYSLSITDATGESVSQDFIITQPTELLLTANTTNATPGNTDGAIDLTVNGGTPSYTYAWSNDATTQDISGLEENTYQITVTDAHQCVATENFTIVESCPIPSAFNVIILGATSATIQWGTLSSANSYQIRYRITGTSTWQSQTISTTSITLNDLTPEAAYEYQVQSHCTGGWSPYSEAANFTLPAPCDAPLNAATVSVTSNTASIAWDAANGASGYIVKYRPTGTSTWLTQSTATNSINLSGLTPTTSYEVIVQTTCGNFNSDFNDAIIFETMQGCEPPTDIIATALSYESFKLDWEEMANSNQFSVRYRITGSTSWSSVDVTTNTVIIEGLESGQTYEYQIQSKCGVAWSNFSEAGEITLPSGCEVLAVTSGDITSESIDVTWNATPGATNYKISYRLAGSTDDWLSFEDTSTVTTIEGLTENTVYAIVVQAYCNLGWGANSTQITVQTSPVGNEDLAISHPFLLYPNPAQSHLTLEFSQRPEQVILINMLGQKVLSTPGQLQMDINIGHLDTGLYYVRAIYPNGQEAASKFLKE